MDAKISLDDNASFHHDGWARFVDPIVPDPFEQRAREHGLHYVHLHGEVGVIGNGAGLVMSSWMPSLALARNRAPTSSPPTSWTSAAALRSVMAESLEIVLSDPQVESVFINVYGGITSCVEVATASSKRSPSSAVPSRSLCRRLTASGCSLAISSTRCRR